MRGIEARRHVGEESALYAKQPRPRASTLRACVPPSLYFDVHSLSPSAVTHDL